MTNPSFYLIVKAYFYVLHKNHNFFLLHSVSFVEKKKKNTKNGYEVLTKKKIDIIGEHNRMR